MLVLAALVAGAVIAVRNSQFSRTKARAMQLSRGATEWIRGEREKGWSEFANHASVGDGSTYCFNDDLNLSWNEGGCGSGELIDPAFKREAVLVKESSEKVKITVTTSWTDSNGYHNEQIITYLTKW